MGYSVTIHSHGTTADTTVLNITGWTTAANNRIKFMVDAAEQFSTFGALDTSAPRLDFAGATDELGVNEENIDFEGMQIDTQDLLRIGTLTGGKVTFHRCLLRSSNSWCVYQNNTGSTGDLDISNCICIGTGATDVVRWNAAVGAVIRCHNVTVVITGTGSTERGFRQVQGTMECVNTLCYMGSSTGVAYGGSYTNSDYNVTDDGAATGGANDQTGQTFSFTDAGSQDFSLTNEDLGARELGVDLRSDADLAVTVDIAGNTRKGLPDAGAFEVDNFHRFVNTASTAGGTGMTSATAGADRAYATMSAAEAAEQIDLTATAQQAPMQIHHEGSTADTTPVTIAGWTTSAAYWLEFMVDAANRSATHGVYDTGSYRLETTSTAISVQEEYTRLTGLQVQITTSASFARGLYHGSALDVTTDLRISYCVVRGVLSGSADTCRAIEMAWEASGSKTMKIWNCVILDWVNAPQTDFQAIYINTSWGNVDIRSCSVHNCYTGYYLTGSGFTAVATNCAADDCTNGWTSGWDAASDYNMSDIASDAPGANSQNGTDWTVVDEGNDDFRPDTGDTTILNLGTDTSGEAAPLNFTDDIRGTARPQGAAWDIGAFENEPAGGGGSILPQMMHHHAAMTRRVA